MNRGVKRGQLRVLLGAAPGVGKTYAMLDEGKRLLGEGKDVVVGFVETHGRATVSAMAVGLEVVPREIVIHRGMELTEMDLRATLARHPEIALVDDLAHSNAPGSTYEKRWQDVDVLLDAGIDVISTVNIEHIESLGGVVEQITGVHQRETIPDRVLRNAYQTEVVDLAPQALRERLAAGVVYPAERIDAARANYFRIGNLTALRELALLWVADDVDNALQSYRAEHGIDSRWDARERVVVALTGGAEGETLLRRGARIAARSAGGELLAVHVTRPDGVRHPQTEGLAELRALTEKLGGAFHQVVGADVPRALVEFARSANATQLVIGVSRRSRLRAALTGPGIGATVIRESGEIDVHIVTHDAAGGRFALPGLGGALSPKRRLAGFALTLIGLPLLTWALVNFRSEESITTEVLFFQLLVVLVAIVGGIWPAISAAVLSGLTLDFLFVAPAFSLSVYEPLHLLALGLYVLNAALVSYVVDQSARRSRAAERSAAESELLATVTGSVVRGKGALQALISLTREAFGLTGVRLLAGAEVLKTDGEPAGNNKSTTVTVGDRANLELHGRDLDGSERRLLAAIVAQIEAALEHSDLTDTARELEPLAATDRVRSALLSAVGHDLRKPLAAATAAVSGLRSADDTWSDADKAELLTTAEESLRALAALLTNLLDVSRLEAGVLGVSIEPVDTEDAITRALDELHLGPAEVELDLDPTLAPVLADDGLLDRVVVNLLANAARFAPPGTRVRISTSALGETVQIRVVDHGPGIPAERIEQVFLPFQRLGDTDNLTGLGLGLALAKGFAEGMGGAVEAEETPGGGLTMVISLQAAERAEGKQ
ncbi:MAG: histidine kinase [Homoserinimonas sp.]|nr:histidine kinase [Homoserinimonas sp.]